jgi:DNA-binding transcriptional MerR regulator
MVPKMSEEKESRYDIGAVSRLTGLSTPNLRMWEKRYRVVEPERTESQRRLYTSDDIRRLTLLKNLVDRGNSIGSIADLSVEQLEARLQEQATRRRAASGRGPRVTRCRVVVVGSLMSELLKSRSGAIDGIRVLKEFDDMDGAIEQLEATAADVLLVECPTLFAETVEAIQELVERTSALRAIVVYRFAQSKTARMIDKDIEGITAIRGPVDITELRLVLQADVALAGNEEPGDSAEAIAEAPGSEDLERLFTDIQLAKISKVSSTVACECPQHLSNLLFGLTAFEKYSEECENRNAEDADLHAYLHRKTSRARRTMEEALREVLAAEGVDIG